MKRLSILETLIIIRLAADTAVGILNDVRTSGVSGSLTGEKLEGLLDTQMSILEVTSDYEKSIPVQARPLHSSTD